MVGLSVTASYQAERRSNLVLIKNHLLHQEIDRESWKTRAEALQAFLKSEHGTRVEWVNEGLVVHPPSGPSVSLPYKQADQVRAPSP